jgi:hypothetical protein
MSIDAQNIIRITKSGVTYIDEQGSEAFIDFSGCYANYWFSFAETKNLQRIKQINNMDDEKLAIWLKKHQDWKEVAKRDITGWLDETKLPFIEFHTIPPIRFIFATEDEFRRVIYEIESFGWCTYDLS